jgi:hypothetical protein
MMTEPGGTVSAPTSQIETAGGAASDQSQGPGWWQASDGKWYPPQQATQQPPPPAPPTPSPVPPPANGLATAALVLGIIGVLFGLIPLTAFVAIILGVLALIFGLVGRSKQTKRTMATWGAALGLASIILAIIGFVILANAVDDVDDAFQDFDNQVAEEGQRELADVDLTSCDVDNTLNTMVATLHVTNNSSERSEYAIDVVFNDEANGNQLGTGFAIVNNLDPDQETDVDADSLESAPAGGFTCDVVSVDRFASN